MSNLDNRNRRTPMPDELAVAVMRQRQIRITPDQTRPTMTLGGWLQGRESYLWIGDECGRPLGTISGHGLYRLAKAIVRHYEADLRHFSRLRKGR